MRTLIACMTFIQEPWQRDLLCAWYALATTLNPGTDLLIVDSASPIPPQSFLPGHWKIHAMADDDEIPKHPGDQFMARFHNSLGHPFYDAVPMGAGSDRAQVKIFEIAIASGYDRAVYIEADVLFVRPVEPWLERMTKPAACPGMVNHGLFPESGLLFFDPAYFQSIDYVKRYNWRGPCFPEGEKRMWDILGDQLEFLPLKGNRDGWGTEPEHLQERYPEGLDFLTHAKIETHREFLRLNDFEGLL